mmetsp:Transcript_1620/g.2476  ORF Transcript_1620/g.2476 Transcript_1620/m.2476 type:complete len:178 (-) Transcript_1620:270-803(-)
MKYIFEMDYPRRVTNDEEIERTVLKRIVRCISPPSHLFRVARKRFSQASLFAYVQRGGDLQKYESLDDAGRYKLLQPFRPVRSAPPSPRSPNYVCTSPRALLAQDFIRFGGKNFDYFVSMPQDEQEATIEILSRIWNEEVQHNDTVDFFEEQYKNEELARQFWNALSQTASIDFHVI